MWIILAISAAFFNALWTAFSKKRLGKISPYLFTVIFRSLTALFLLPVFLYDFKISINPIFWFAVLGAGTLEMIGIQAQAAGIKKDYYSTYSLASVSPLFTLIIAPQLLPEKINLILVLGVILTVIGGLIFYQINRRFSIYGIIRALTMSISTILAKIAIGYSSGLTYPFIAFTIGIWVMVLAGPFTKESIDWSMLKPFIKILLPLAVLSTIATLSYYVALEIAPITRVNPLIRINLFFGFLLSYFILKERGYLKRKIFASTLVIIGTVCITLS